VFTLLSIITTTTLTWALWARRHTWRYRWEYHGTLAVALLTPASLLTSPLGDLTNQQLHNLTGLWNLQYLAAQIFVVGGFASAVYHSVEKLTPDEQIRHWGITRLRYPSLAGITLMTILYTTSPTTDKPQPNLFTTPTPHLAAYWLTTAALVTYLVYQGIRALLDLWHDPPSRRTVDIYLTSGACITTAIIMRLIDTILIEPDPDPLILGIGRTAFQLGITIYAYGVAQSWTRRVHWFTRVPLSPEPQQQYDDPQALEGR
jgi:hypothetical protein